MTTAPQRGDLVWLSFDPQAGHEQGSRGPAVVLSPAARNDAVGLFLRCPVTGRVKGYPFEVAPPDGLPIHGVVLAEQVKSLDWRARHVEIAGTAPAKVIREVLGKLATLLS